MIKRNKSIIVIISLSLFLFIGYNVLTVEASEKDDKKVCESYGGEWKETIMVDVDGNEKGSGERQCQFDNDKDLKLYSIRPGYSLDGTGPDGEYGRIDLDMSDEEAANIEDEICDDEDADTTDVKGCKSDDKKEKVEDWRNTVTTTEDEELKEAAQKIAESEPFENYPIKQVPVDPEEADSSEESNDDIADYNNEAEFEEEDIDDDSSENDESEEQDEDESDGEEESDDSEDSSEE